MLTTGTFDYQRDEHRVHLVIYHLVWAPKRRKKVLVGDVARDLAEIVRAKCAEKKWEVLELAIEPDHVHLFVRVGPQDDASSVVRHCKGPSSRILRQRYPTLRRLPSLWTRSFFVSTAGMVSAQTIQRYVAAQSTY